MKKEIIELYNLYLKINKHGWIKSKRNGPGGVGYTFEALLNKDEDTFPLADFNGLEIKTMRKNSRRVLHLFNITPDGDYLFPIKRILDKLGYPSKTTPEYKVFKMCVNALEYTKLGLSKKAKLYVNREKQRIDLIATTSKGKKIDVDVSWSFELLLERINWKLRYLVIILADNKFLDDVEYFRYSDIYFYELKDFDTFLRLIELGVITITFNIDVFKSGRRLGQIYDHGTCFSISYGYIGNLYNKLLIDKM